MILIRKLYFKLLDVSWLILTISTILLILLSTVSLRYIEPDTFTSFLDSFWFTMTTILTVGYGDISPATIAGKVFTIFFLYFVGIGLFATFVGKMIDGVSAYKKRRERGDIVFEGRNHYVIIDWSHKAENAVASILEKDKKAEIVIIDTLPKFEYDSPHVHYVRGNASDVKVLCRANVQEAKAVIIFADDRIHDQMLTDGKSLMIACAVERISPNVYTTVEIEREEHMDNFSHVKVDKFILSNGTIAKIIVDSIA